jgi:hypothetical protein
MTPEKIAQAYKLLSGKEVNTATLQRISTYMQAMGVKQSDAFLAVACMLAIESDAAATSISKAIQTETGKVEALKASLKRVLNGMADEAVSDAKLQLTNETKRALKIENWKHIAIIASFAGILVATIIGFTAWFTWTTANENANLRIADTQKWTLTEDGKSAYALSQAQPGEVTKVLKCLKDGWEKTNKGSTIKPNYYCFPYANKSGTLYGFHVPQK